ncbi:MAG: sugar ABC transporter permease [Acidimicrobiia bacterium]
MTERSVEVEPAPPKPPPEGGAGQGVGVGLLRIVASLAVPIVAFALLAWSFNFLKDQNASKLLVVIVALVVGVFGVFALYWGMDLLIKLLPEHVGSRIRPFAFVGPALVILTIFLVYPAVNTIWLSFRGPHGDTFVGVDNYAFVFSSAEMLRAIRNTLGWVIVVPVVATAIGLGFAVLADKLKRTEAFSKSMIFLPMAVSFVGAAIVWRFVYNFRPEGFGEQIGLLNGFMVSVGANPVPWLQQQPWNNLMLMVIMIWMQTGFAMVILSSAIKAVPTDIIEAARIDGAGEVQVFWRVIVPNIMSTIVVVLTTMVINVLKIFDIVFVMTGGQFGTEIVAQEMIKQFFTLRQWGHGAAIAVFMFIAVIPVMILNVRRFREEEAIR